MTRLRIYRVRRVAFEHAPPLSPPPTSTPPDALLAHGRYGVRHETRGVDLARSVGAAQPGVRAAFYEARPDADSGAAGFQQATLITNHVGASSRVTSLHAKPSEYIPSGFTKAR